jgi:Reverse transcriptase (RNA-dependent DNA polymerase)
VDDLGLIASTKALMASAKTLLHANFTMKDLGEMLKILGIRVEIDPDRDFIKLSQGHFIDVIVQRFHLGDAPPVDTPVLQDIKSLEPRSAKDPSD